MKASDPEYARERMRKLGARQLCALKAERWVSLDGRLHLLVPTADGWSLWAEVLGSPDILSADDTLTAAGFGED